MIDRRPAAIVRCISAADVAAAVRFAAREGLYPAIRAGGHNVAGLASVDGGLVIDVSRDEADCRRPSRADGYQRDGSHVARVRCGDAGITAWRRQVAVNSTTGIAGLTLGGGIGCLMGRCGLSCDNTIEYSLIKADGEPVTASGEQHPDLFWALKGGGGNFGVVTSITYRLHPVSTVHLGYDSLSVYAGA